MEITQNYGEDHQLTHKEIMIVSVKSTDLYLLFLICGEWAGVSFWDVGCTQTKQLFSWQQQQQLLARTLMSLRQKLHHAGGTARLYLPCAAARRCPLVSLAPSWWVRPWSVDVYVWKLRLKRLTSKEWPKRMGVWAWTGAMRRNHRGAVTVKICISQWRTRHDRQQCHIQIFRVAS